MEGSGRGLIDAVSPHFPTAAQKPSVKNEDNPDKKNRNGKLRVYINHQLLCTDYYLFVKY